MINKAFQHFSRWYIIDQRQLKLILSLVGSWDTLYVLYMRWWMIHLAYSLAIWWSICVIGSHCCSSSFSDIAWAVLEAWASKEEEVIEAKLHQKCCCCYSVIMGEGKGGGLFFQMKLFHDAFIFSTINLIYLFFSPFDNISWCSNVNAFSFLKWKLPNFVMDVIRKVGDD